MLLALPEPLGAVPPDVRADAEEFASEWRREWPGLTWDTEQSKRSRRVTARERELEFVRPCEPGIVGESRTHEVRRLS